MSQIIEETEVGKVMRELTELKMRLDGFIERAKNVVSEVEKLEGPEYAALFRSDINKLDLSISVLANLVDGVLPQW